jgi:hypothetical protein
MADAVMIDNYLNIYREKRITITENWFTSYRTLYPVGSDCEWAMYSSQS